MTYRCSATMAAIRPDGLEDVQFCAFSFCSSLTTVKLGQKLRRLGEAASEGSSNYESIFIHKQLNNNQYPVDILRWAVSL
jgi:hypothetical protein